MNVMLKADVCLITWQKGDRSANFWNESRLLHQLKKHLILTYGLELIKKRMWKDGHMVDQEQQYIRTTHWKSKAPHICIYNPNYALYDAGQQFRQAKIIELRIAHDIFGKIKKCDRCGKPVVHENGGMRTPPEAILCGYCNRYVCPKCANDEPYRNLALPHRACRDCVKIMAPTTGRIMVMRRKLIIPGITKGA